MKSALSFVIGKDNSRMLGGVCATTLIAVVNRDSEGLRFSVKESELSRDRKVALAVLEWCELIVSKVSKPVASQLGLVSYAPTPAGRKIGSKLKKHFVSYILRRNAP
jgi:hypothetical protein